MWKVLGILSILAFLVFIVLGIVNVVRKNGKAKRSFLYALVSMVLAFIGVNMDASSSKETVQQQSYEVKDVPKYSIADEETNNTRKKIRVTTTATSESDLRKIVLDIRNKYQTDEAVWLYIHEPDNNPNGNGYGTLKASARFGNTKLGIAAVGTKNIEDYIFEKK
jgi:hypothetical protein